MHLLIPGRHHLLTNFQFNYINTLISGEFNHVKDVEGKAITTNASIESLIFAVTSANHSGTKRNPVSFYLRAMLLQSFSEALNIPCYIYGVDDVGTIENFADHVLKQVRHQSDHKLNLTPQNTWVLCSTPVLSGYLKLGYTILPCELKDLDSQAYHHDLPWRFVEKIAETADLSAPLLQEQLHSSIIGIWKNYDLPSRVSQIMNDPILGDDGDLTESRDYNSYVRQMDEIAELKYSETPPFIISGNIGDIGCAVGSWIKFASRDSRLVESDFYGIEVTRQLFDICNQRKVNQEFNNPNVFFAQKNAVSELVFQKGTMHTIHTSSLTHEIASYGSMDDLQRFINNRNEELTTGGVWINRDVIGPENGTSMVLLYLNRDDGVNDDFDRQFSSRQELSTYLKNLSTYTRFKRFVMDFRKQEQDQIHYKEIEIEEKQYLKLMMADACEFMLTKDYTDNWESEMHERFCFWSFGDWKVKIEQAGFRIQPGSGAYTNPWIEQNRFKGSATLYQIQNGKLMQLPSPPTNALIIGKKLTDT